MLTKNLIKEISHGKNLEANLAKYMNELMTVHNITANLSLTFHYYSFQEMVLDYDYSRLQGFEDLLKRVNRIMKDTFVQKADIEQMNENVKELFEVRETVINRMKVLTVYTDIFQNYEYVLNRIEYRFQEGIIRPDDSEVVAQMLKYIFEDKDSAVISAKVQELVGQLPIRMTKSRFLELLKNSLILYKGSDKAALETYLYMIRTGAALDRPEGFEVEFPELVELKKMFDGVDYKNIDQPKYNELSQKLQRTVEILETTAQAYYTLEEVINALGTVLLTKPYANLSNEYASYERTLERCNQIIAGLSQVDYENDHTIAEEYDEYLDKLTGKQEKLIDILMYVDSHFYDITAQHGALIDSLMLTKGYNCLDYVLKLQSTSIFVDLDLVANQGIVDDIYMKKVEHQLMEEFNVLFSNNGQLLNRAIMANVLMKMPTFFESADEIQEYVTSSIMNCRDEAEKLASIRLIQDIIA